MYDNVDLAALLYIDRIVRQIFEILSGDSITYVLDEEAQKYFNQIREVVTKGVSEESSAVVVDCQISDEEDSREEEEDPVRPIRTYLGKKYCDQLARLALSLHVLNV